MSASLLFVKNNTLTFNGTNYRCAIGKGGFSTNKREGDGCTPVGTYGLRECWYRLDRLPPPQTGLPLKVIHENDGWCDDAESADYNKHVKLPLPLGEGWGEGPSSYHYTKPELITRSRELLHNSTTPEQKLWAILRNRQMNGYKFRRQHTIAPYIADFYCEELKLIIELDGDSHATEEGIIKDARRTAFLEQSGYRIMRFSNHDMRDNFEGIADSIFSFTDGKRALTPALSQGEREYSFENLWRTDHVYDLIIPLGYNDAPITPGKGSAIFMHIAKPDYAPTEGCVALALIDLLAILPHLSTKTQITIHE